LKVKSSIFSASSYRTGEIDFHKAKIKSKKSKVVFWYKIPEKF